jgi:hypothetical protein
MNHQLPLLEMANAGLALFSLGKDPKNEGGRVLMPEIV